MGTLSSRRLRGTDAKGYDLRPACPKHPKSRVWLDGTYGAPERRRQRYRCVPDNGDRWHRFTEPLPRRQALAGDCPECERPLAAHEGLPAPRRCVFTASEIAATLVKVGEGMTYRAAGRSVRRRADRLKPARGLVPAHPSSDSPVVEDWVEAFAPLVFEESAPREWPEVLVLDDLPFRVRSTQSRSGSVVAFRIFAALGSQARGSSSVVRMQGFPDKTPTSWEAFFRELDGSPSLIVCDAESGMLRGIERAFGSRPYASPVIWLCHKHLKLALGKLLHRHHAHPVLVAALEDAFAHPTCWDRFVRFADRYPNGALNRWLSQPDPTWWSGQTTREERIVWQLEQQTYDLPASTGALEAHLHWLRAKIKSRSFALRNRERTNRMLSLIQLHLNGQDDERAYSRLIRQKLTRAGGRGPERHQIEDPRGYASLWH